VLALLAVVAYAFVVRSGRALAGLGVVAAILAAGLVVTFSRSSALGLIVGLVLLAVRRFGVWRALGVGVAVLALLTGLAVLRNHNVERLLTSRHRIERVSEGRFDLVKGGLTIWREHPVVGTGVGSFEREYSETLTPAEQKRVRVIISHNAPVTVLSEVGVVGFALFLWLLVATAWRIGRISLEPDPTGWAAWTILAMLAAILIHSLLYAALFEDPYTWVLAGAAIGLGALRPSEAPERAPRPPEPVPVA
jgi:O-antigen ligase